MNPTQISETSARRGLRSIALFMLKNDLRKFDRESIDLTNCSLGSSYEMFGIWG